MVERILPRGFLAVLAAASLILVSSFLRGRAYADAAGVARMLALALVGPGIVALGLAVFGLMTMAASRP